MYLDQTEYCTPLPPVTDASTFMANPPVEPKPLIEGLLNRGEKMLIGGAAKVGKTWLALDAATAVATGTPWLGFETIQGKVLFINMELTENALYHRLKKVCDTKDIQLEPDQLLIWNLRGHQADMKRIADNINGSNLEDLALVIPDPMYKTLGEWDENSARDVAKLLAHVDRVVRETKAAVLLTHHFAKSAKGKAGIDQFSGSAVWVRDPDVLANIQEEADKQKRALNITRRNGESPEPMFLDGNFPVMSRCAGTPSVTVANVSVTPCCKSAPTVEEFVELFPGEFDEKAPRAALLSSGEVRTAMEGKKWNDGVYRDLLNQASKADLLREIKGPKANEKLHGRPEVVAQYAAATMAKKTEEAVLVS